MNDKTNLKVDGIAAAASGGAESRQGPITMARALAVTAAAALLIGIIVGPIVANNHATAADASTTPEHVISVSGSGQVSVSPDVADVYVGVSVNKPTAKDARTAAAAQMAAVIAAIKKTGVADKDITTTGVNLSPVYDYNGGTARLTGYQFSNTVKAIVRDTTRIADVVDDAVAAGATTIQGITFRLDNPKTVEAQARALAIADARAKADALAQAAGVSIKGVAMISETTSSSGPIYYAAPMAADKAAGTSTPIQTGSTDIQIQVSVSYLIG
jgi:uncharacterized protein YggE